MMKNKYLYVDTLDGKSRYITDKQFFNYTVGDEYDGHDSKGYFMTYKLDDGKIEKEYYNWRDNWDYIKRNATHTVYVNASEDYMIIDFTNKKLRGNK
jgi:hypothetical protein